MTPYVSTFWVDAAYHKSDDFFLSLNSQPRFPAVSQPVRRELLVLLPTCRTEENCHFGLLSLKTIGRSLTGGKQTPNKRKISELNLKTHFRVAASQFA